MIKPEIVLKGKDAATKDLETFRRRAMPYAMRSALNTAVFEARSIWQGIMRADFTLRNRYTERSVLVQRTEGNRIEDMRAVVGTTAEYMPDQEEGATVRGGGAHKGIPAPAAAGLQPGAKRTRTVRARYKLSAVKVDHSKLTGSRHQRNAIAMAMAVRAGKRIALLERPAGGKALFRVLGPMRKLSTRLLWDFSRSSVRVPAHPTLQRTIASLERKLPHMLEAAARHQLQRFDIPGW